MESWQLTEDNHIDALFKWLDHNEDGLITFDDL
jgi:Ca2+-binding EF-hand superfamily protein